MFFDKKNEATNKRILQNKKTLGNVELILASSSLGRKQVLEKLGVTFRIDPANIDERSIKEFKAENLISAIALKKAEAIQGKYKNGIILSADTMIVCDGEIIGKPKDSKDAERILTKLSNNTHQVITCLVLIDVSTGKTIKRTATTRITFKKLSESDISKYVTTTEPFGKAGAYALQGNGIFFVKEIEGEKSTVYGLPEQEFLNALSDLDFNLVTVPSTSAFNYN